MRKFFVVGRDSEYTGDVSEGDRASDRGPRSGSMPESTLVLLLSEISRQAGEITEIGDKEPSHVMKILSDMVNRVSEFSIGADIPGSREGLLSEALAEASVGGSQVGLLHADRGRLSAQTAVNLYKGWTGSRDDRNRVFRQISLGMVSILESYFRSIHEALVTPSAAVEWKEAFDVCVDELSSSVKSVTF